MQKTADLRKRGQEHPRAVLTDREVDALRDLWDEGGWSYGQLAEKFSISKTSARELVLCKKRA